MKRLVILTGILTILLNTLAGMIVPAYEEFKMLLNDYVILFSTIMVLFVNNKYDKLAYRISLSLFVVVLGAIQFVMGLLACNGFMSNPFLFGIVAMQVIEIVVMSIVKYFSKYA